MKFKKTVFSLVLCFVFTLCSFTSTFAYSHNTDIITLQELLKINNIQLNKNDEVEIINTNCSNIKKFSTIDSNVINIRKYLGDNKVENITLIPYVIYDNDKVEISPIYQTKGNNQDIKIKFPSVTIISTAYFKKHHATGNTGTYIQPLGVDVKWVSSEDNNDVTVSSLDVEYISQGILYSYPECIDGAYPESLDGNYIYSSSISENNPSEGLYYASYEPFDEDRALYVFGGSPFAGQSINVDITAIINGREKNWNDGVSF